MIHVVLIVLHTVFATAAFILGCLLLVRLPGSHASKMFRSWQGSLVLMLVFLVAVIVVDWPRLSVVTATAYTGLAVLAAYLVVRSVQADSELRGGPDGWQSRFVGHVGFTLISLFDAFCIVTAIDLGAPVVVVVLTAAAGVVAGVLVVNRVRAREAARISKGT